MTGPIDGRKIVADLERLGQTETSKLVRHGLAAIADRIRDLEAELDDAGNDRVTRDEVLLLVDPAR